jgi:hypothetical protein
MARATSDKDVESVPHTQKKVMIKRPLKYWMKMECGIKDGCLPFISVQDSGS